MKILLIVFLFSLILNTGYTKTVSNQTTRPYCFVDYKGCKKLNNHFKNSSNAKMKFSPRCEKASPAIIDNFCHSKTKWVLWLKLTVTLEN